MLRYLPVIIIILSPISVASQYRTEFFAGYSDADADFLDEETRYSFGGSWYFSGVDSSLGPLSEAVYMDRAGFVSVSHGQSNTSTVNQLHNDSRFQFLSGRYVHKPSGWYVFGSYGRGDRDSSFGDFDMGSYGLAVGKYIFQNTVVALTYGETTEKTDYPTDLCTDFLGFDCPATIKDKYIETTNSISFKHLATIWDHYYSLFLSYSKGELKFRSELVSTELPTLRRRKTEDTHSYGVGIDVYPSSSLGIGMAYSNTDDGFVKTESYEVGVRWFFLDNAAVNLGYTVSKPDGNVFGYSPDEDTVSSGLTVRF